MFFVPTLSVGSFCKSTAGNSTNGGSLPSQSFWKRTSFGQGFHFAGILGTLQSEVAALAERERRELMEIAYRTADDTSILGLAPHLMFIGERSP